MLPILPLNVTNLAWLDYEDPMNRFVEYLGDRSGEKSQKTQEV